MTPRALKTPGLVASGFLEHDLRSGRERNGARRCGGEHGGRAAAVLGDLCDLVSTRAEVESEHGLGSGGVWRGQGGRGAL
ncbi:hypothetical protein M0R45_019744 [Rubus argutus]|uniref:Uncharacterized protein n=1 Tax=Rubus argutus TaxID=59490 RepID=A0AAW1X7N8_RUBAR